MTQFGVTTEADLSAAVERAEQAMHEFGVVTEARTVRFERVLPGPIERVWAYLTESEKRGSWLASGPMELRVGGRVELTFNNSDLSPHAETPPDRYASREGSSLCGRVTRWEPPRPLGYTWGGEPGKASEVTFELTPHDGNVLLVLTHRRLGGRGAMVSVASGWHTHLGRPPRPSGRPRAAPLLVDPCASGGGIREAASGRLINLARGFEEPAAATVVNLRQVREFARATGRLAKLVLGPPEGWTRGTDRLAAAAIAHFAAAVKPAPRALPDAARQALIDLVATRRQLVDMRVAEKARRAARPSASPTPRRALGAAR